MRKLFIVGDSTLSKFDDRSYYYPRYGYGTQLSYYLNDEIEVINLALSGRSSKSYLNENNYQILKNSIKKDDFLIIGFGHNNEKDDDVARFTSANKPIDDETSFMYSLNEYYVKLAKSVGAIPILCTPIVRLALDKDYTGYNIHETSNGNYRKNILDLALMVDVLGIDLTTPTKDLFASLSVSDASLHHAYTAGILVDGKVVPNIKSVDKAHLNIYGARYVAYLVCKAIKEANHPLSYYLLDNVCEPIKEEVLKMNELYKFIPYNEPDLINYKPVDHFKVSLDGWYGTCFGDVGVNPLDKESGYVAYSEDDKFIVGQYGDVNNGKFHASADGFACVFKQVSVKYNFTVKCKAKVIKHKPLKQTSFGLMLRDDIYLNQESGRESTMNNYISAGFLTLNVSTNIIHARECTTELNMSKNIFDGFYNLGDEAYLEIERLGQAVVAKVLYKGQEYVKNYIDFDLVGVDNNYMYICFYSTCGTVIEFSDIEFNVTGIAKEA